MAFTPIDGVNKIDLAPENIANIWCPDIFFRNAKSSNLHEVAAMTNAFAKLSSDGYVIYVYK